MDKHAIGKKQPDQKAILKEQIRKKKKKFETSSTATTAKGNTQ